MGWTMTPNIKNLNKNQSNAFNGMIFPPLFVSMVLLLLVVDVCSKTFSQPNEIGNTKNKTDERVQVLVHHPKRLRSFS